MTVDANHLDQIVVCETGQGLHHAMGHMVGYADFPTVLVNVGPNQQMHWAAHLSRPATPEETLEYWQKRAYAAEEKAAHNARLAEQEQKGQEGESRE